MTLDELLGEYTETSTTVKRKEEAQQRQTRQQQRAAKHEKEQANRAAREALPLEGPALAISTQALANALGGRATSDKRVNPELRKGKKK